MPSSHVNLELIDRVLVPIAESDRLDREFFWGELQAIQQQVEHLLQQVAAKVEAIGHKAAVVSRGIRGGIRFYLTVQRR